MYHCPRRNKGSLDRGVVNKGVVMGMQNNQGELFIMMALVDGPNLHDLIFSKKYQVKKTT